MSTNWDSFNSHFLNALHKHWGGVFHGKFLEALQNFQEQKDINQMVFKMFPYEEMEITVPTPRAVKKFNQGDVGRDLTVLMFLDKQVHMILQELIHKEFSAANELIDRTLSLLESEDVTMERYSILLGALKSIASGSEQPLPIPMVNTEDLSFFGCLSLLDAFFSKEDGYYEKAPFKPQIEEMLNVSHQNYLGVDADILKNIYSQAESLYPPDTVLLWIEMNQGLIPVKYAYPAIQEILPDVLKESSFLWKSELLDISPMAIEAMTEEERLLTLIKNKSAILENCFDELRFKSGSKERLKSGGLLDKRILSIDTKNSIMKLGEELSNLLERRSMKSGELIDATSRAKELKNAFIELAEQEGMTERAASIKLLQLIETRNLPIAPQDTMEGILLKNLKDYQKAIFDHKILGRQVVDLSQEIEQKREVLETAFKGLLKEIWNKHLLDSVNEKEVLKIYATFSFILLNKDLFPTLSFKKEVKQKAAGKIQKLAEKWEKKKALKSAFKKLKTPTTKEALSQDNLFQEIINEQVERNYRSYEPQTSTYKAKQLTSKEVEQISLVAKKLQEETNQGKPEAAQKFLRLESTLETIFVKDKAFLATLSRSERTNPQKVAALQAHIDAALLFTGGEESLPFTGVSNSKGFETLFNRAMHAISDEGIKEKIFSTSDQLIKNAQALVPVSHDSVGKIIEKELNKKNYSQLKKEVLKLEKKETLPKVADQIDKYNKAYESLKDYFHEQIYGENYRWIQTFGSLEGIFNALPPSFEKYSNRDMQKAFYEEPIFKQLPHEFRFAIPPASKQDYYLAFRRFFRENKKENKFEILPLEKQKKGIFQEPVANVARLMLIPWIANRIQDRINELEMSQLGYNAITHRDPLGLETADVFSDRTLFQFMESQREVSKEEGNRSHKVYQDFLPIFISSFLITNRVFKKGREKLNQAKMKFIEDMPGAKVLHAELEEWLEKNERGIQELNTYLKDAAEKYQEGLDESGDIGSFLITEVDKAKKEFSGLFGSIEDEVKRWALTSTVIAGGLFIAFGITPSAGSLIAITLLSGLLGYVTQKSVLPFLDKLLNTAWEYIQYYTGTGDYSPGAPSKYLFKTLETALLNEIKSFESFKDIRHRLSFGLYLQEMFDVLEESQNNLLSFRNRINGLIHFDTKETNFSVMALNMFNMLNKDLFLILPDDMLSDAKNPYFIAAVEEYLRKHQAVIEEAGQGFLGEKKLSYDFNTSYYDYLKEKADKGEIIVYCDENSAIGRFFGRRAQRFKVLPKQIVTLKQDSKQIVDNTQEFFNTAKTILESRYRLESKLGTTFKIFSTSFNQPLDKWQKEKVLSLIPCFEIVRYGLSLAQSFNDVYKGDQTNPIAPWVMATKETPSSILSSNLFQTALSTLRKLAEVSSGMGIPEGQTLLRSIKKITNIQQNFLAGQPLILPPYEEIERVKTSLIQLIDSRLPENSAIAYPVLMSLETNKNLMLPIILWNHFKENVSDPEIIQLGNNSRLLYLTNQEFELFNTPENRGFVLSPFVVGAIQANINRYANEGLLKFLGRAESISEEMENALFNPLPKRYNLPFMVPEYLRKRIGGGARPQLALGYGQEEPNIPQNQTWIQPNTRNRIDPIYDVSQREYDPDNMGLTPEQAYYTYQDRLPEGVLNKLKAGIEKQEQQRIPLSQVGQPSSSINSQNKGNVLGGQNLPQILPMNMNLEEERVENPQVEKLQNENLQVENPIQVGVNSQGKTVSMGAGGSDANDYGRRLLENIDRRNMEIQEMQGNSFPEPYNQPYRNPVNQNYDPEIQENPFPWGKAAAIGGGAALGAGLLGYLMSDSDKKKRKK